MPGSKPQGGSYHEKNIGNDSRRGSHGAGARGIQTQTRASEKKGRRKRAATKAVFDALEDMCIEPDEISSAAENAENLEEAISCFIDYGEYSVSGIMREVRAAYKEAEL